MTRIVTAFCLLLATVGSVAQNQPPAAFNGIDEWKRFLAASDITSLKTLYSLDPPAKFVAKNKQRSPNISPEIDFWQNIVASGISDVEVDTLDQTDKQGSRIVSLAVTLKIKTPNGPRTRYVTEQQAWQPQASGWRIVLTTHSDLVKMPPALSRNPNLYDKNADAKSQIKEALARAASSHQRVILVFGANLCYDCHVLDRAFHQPDITPILEKSFQVVHVDIGDDGKKNNDLAMKYGIPLEKGIPALAILGSDSKLLYSQKQGEWESARSLDPDDVVAFLNKWKP